MRARRCSRIEPMRGSAIFDIVRYSVTKISVSQSSCDGKVCLSNGGNGRACPPAGTSTDVPVGAVSLAITDSEGYALPPSEGEQQQQCDQQRKDAERLGDREAEDEVAELALRGR